MKLNFKLLILFVVLLGIFFVVYFNSDQSVSGDPQRNFGIKDTSSIDQIIMTDTDERYIKLSKNEDNTWSLNDNMEARQDAVKTLLQTIRHLSVKHDISRKMHKGVVRQLISRHKKVEIYQNGNLSKTIFIGDDTPNHEGTYMLLETPERGRSPEAFVVHIPNFKGFLNPRFFLNYDEWVSLKIWSLPVSKIASIKIRVDEDPNESFEIVYDTGNNISLLDEDGKKIPTFDTLAVKDYMLLYKFVNFNLYNTELEQKMIDSIVSSTPFYTITVKEKNGNSKELKIFHKDKDSGPDLLDSPEKDKFKYDVDYTWGYIDQKQFVRLQYFHIGKLLMLKSQFSPGSIVNKNPS